jgi:hypothetical protein
MSHRVCGMVGDGLRIDPAGGVDRAHLRQQGAEFVQRAEMRRRPSQDVDKGLLGVLPPAEGAEQHRALDFGIDGNAGAAWAREVLLKLPQPGFLRQTGRPAGIAFDDVMQGSRVLSRSGRDARGSVTPLSTDSCHPHCDYAGRRRHC